MKPVSVLLFFLGLVIAPSSTMAAQDSTAIETKVKTLFIDPESQAPVIILETIPDKRRLPIWINVAEARAIALELEHVTLPRPLTHDLIRNMLKAMGATLQRVTITELRNDTYFARLSLLVKGQRLEIDSRPSDAIAIALRMKAPIFASTQVLSQVKPFSTPLAEAEQAKLGIQSQTLTQDLATLLDSPQQKGAVITDVKLGGAAMNAGLQRGDIITKLDARAIASSADLESALQAVKSPGKVTLEVIKKGKPTTIVIDLPS